MKGRMEFLKVVYLRKKDFLTGLFFTLLDSADPNIELCYAWDYVCNVGKRVYRLSAPCFLSGQNWLRLTAQLKKIVLENLGQINSFEYRCARNAGGNETNKFRG